MIRLLSLSVVCVMMAACSSAPPMSTKLDMTTLEPANKTIPSELLELEGKEDL